MNKQVEYLPYTIYINVLIMMEKYRGKKLQGERIKNAQEFMKKILFQDTIEFSDTTDSLIIVIVNNNKQKPLKSKDMQMVFSKIELENKPQGFELIIISNEEFSSFIKKVVEVERNKYPKSLIRTVLYKHFKLELPNHKAIYPHRILTKEESATIIEQQKIAKRNLPKMLKDEAMSVWIGARQGDIVEIKRPHECSGYELAYRRVV